MDTNVPNILLTIASSLYIRKEKLGTDWLKEQQVLLDALSPECRQCSVYGACGGACIVSQEHALECRFY